MNMKKLKDEKGVALVLVITVMLVGTILAMAILMRYLSDTKFAIYEGKQMQAYYLAKSGVEATASWMLDTSNNGSSLIGKTSTSTVLQNGIDGTFTVEVINWSATELLIKGTGNVDGVTAQTGMTLEKAGDAGPAPVFENTITAIDRIILEGNTSVEGDIASGMSSPDGIVTNGKAFDVSGTSTQGSVINAPPIVFPADPSTADDITYIGNVTRTLDIAADYDQTVVYKNMTMSNGILEITTGTANNVVNLVVDELNLQNGTVKIIGDGILHLFVKTNAIFKTDTNYNDPLISKPSQLIVFLGDGCGAYLDANDKFNGFIYGPGANISIKGNNGFKGAIIGKTITCGGTPFINYDPAGDDITYDMLPVFYFIRGNWGKP